MFLYHSSIFHCNNHRPSLTQFASCYAFSLQLLDLSNNFFLSNKVHICSCYLNEVINVESGEDILTLLYTVMCKIVQWCLAPTIYSVSFYTKHLTWIGDIQIYLWKTCFWNIYISPHSLPVLWLMCCALLEALKAIMFLSFL